MSYQKCPVCEGTGISTHNYTSSSLHNCKVCNGYGIISELTGKPPSFKSENTMNNDKENAGDYFIK